MKRDVPKFELDEVRGWCGDSIIAGKSHFRGMTFEEGVDAAIEWLTNGGDRPDAE